MRKIILGLLFIMTWTVCPSLAGKVFFLEVDGTINPVTADYIRSGLYNAEYEEASAAVIKLDTPGGLMDSMRQIIKDMDAAPLPVIIYVGDSGARAASAGAFITLAADISVMAQGTNIGAAHPVSMGNREVSDEMNTKMTEDARAFIKAIALKHGRNAGWAQKAVTESVSITAEEALDDNVVDYNVKDFSDLEKKLQGTEYTKNGKVYVIDFGQGLKKFGMGFFKKFLSYIANPNMAYILLILGVYGLIYEFSNPGIGLGAVAGGISLMLAALAMQVIPVNATGILLIIFGVLLLVVDIWVPSYGILTVGGLVSFIMGSLTIFDVENFPLEVSLSLIAGATAATALFFIFAVSSGITIQRKKVSTGTEGMIGQEGKVMDDFETEGKIFVRGEIWEAVSVGGLLAKGSKVIVKGVNGNIVEVEKKEER